MYGLHYFVVVQIVFEEVSWQASFVHSMNGLNSQSSVDDYHICLFINVGHDWIVLGFILCVGETTLSHLILRFLLTFIQNYGW